MGASINIEAAVLARITKRVKITPLGNPLPVVANLFKLAEEVLLAVREIGKELGLIDLYERKPGSRPLPPLGVGEPVAESVAAAAAW